MSHHMLTINTAAILKSTAATAMPVEGVPDIRWVPSNLGVDAFA